MATQESMAIRANEALDKIEAAVSALHGSPVESVQRLYRDREMLRVMQLEQIAKWLEELANAPTQRVEIEAAFDGMTAEILVRESPVIKEIAKSAAQASTRKPKR